jgi:large subunit ribosomal protein L11
MAKEIATYVKLQVKGGQANPCTARRSALGSKGVNIMEFCKQFNARTQDKIGKVVPVIITVYTDKSFDFVIKTAPAPVQLMEAAKIQKGSKESNRSKWAR